MKRILVNALFHNFIVDAFVALGGQSDKTGYVDADKLIQIVKHEFGMTIDIEVKHICLNFRN